MRDDIDELVNISRDVFFNVSCRNKSYGDWRKGNVDQISFIPSFIILYLYYDLLKILHYLLFRPRLFAVKSIMLNLTN